MIRRLFNNLVLLGLGVLLGVLVIYYMTNEFQNLVPEIGLVEVTETSSDALLERIQKVYKMVVVEGEFADIVSHKSYNGWDLPGFKKQALLKVKAKVAVGYDLEGLLMEMDEVNKIINIQNLPKPEIMSIDSDISYYDFEEGMFNVFSEAELNRLHKAAKDSIRVKALRSELMTQAENQADEMIDLMTFFAQQEGWKIAYKDTISPNSEFLIQPIPEDSDSVKKRPVSISIKRDTTKKNPADNNQ